MFIIKHSSMRFMKRENIKMKCWDHIKKWENKKWMNKSKEIDNEEFDEMRVIEIKINDIVLLNIISIRLFIITSHFIFFIIRFLFSSHFNFNCEWHQFCKVFNSWFENSWWITLNDWYIFQHFLNLSDFLQIEFTDLNSN